MPGGGSNLDIIEAARSHGLRFVAHTETAGAIMAAAQAEITRAPGVCLSTLGPGVSSLVNGVAHAWLDRVPLGAGAHRRHGARRTTPVRAPEPAACGAPRTDHPADGGTDAGFDRRRRRPLIACSLGPPPGPVHIDCDFTATPAPREPGPLDSRTGARAAGVALTATARRLLQSATRRAGGGGAWRTRLRRCGRSARPVRATIAPGPDDVQPQGGRRRSSPAVPRASSRSARSSARSSNRPICC